MKKTANQLRATPNPCGMRTPRRRRRPFWIVVSLAVLAVPFHATVARAAARTVYGVSTTHRTTVVVAPRPVVVVAPPPRVVVVAPAPVVVALPSGYIAVLPAGYRAVMVGGARYYYVGGIHYQARFYQGRTVYVRVRL
jgi:hypothetical protein